MSKDEAETLGLQRLIKPRQVPIPESFPRYHERLKRLLGTEESAPSDEQVVHRLPPSVHMLAKLGEETAEFKQLVVDLMGSSASDSKAESELRVGCEARLTDVSPTDFLKSLVRRSGYYHAVIAKEEPQPYWQRIVDRVQYGEREMVCLWLLPRCHFPRRSFELAGFTVVWMKQEELASLGADPRACEDFYPEERLDLGGATGHWFLKRSEAVPSGYTGVKDWLQEKKARDEDLAARLATADAEIDALEKAIAMRGATPGDAAVEALEGTGEQTPPKVKG